MRFGPVPVAEALGVCCPCGARRRPGAEEGRPHRRGRVARSPRPGSRPSSSPSRTGGHGRGCAAAAIAASVAGEGLRVDPAFTGRANLFAAHAGVLVVDREASTAEPHRRGDHLRDAAGLRRRRGRRNGRDGQDHPLCRAGGSGEGGRQRPAGPVAPFVRRRVAVISTLLPGLPTRWWRRHCG